MINYKEDINLSVGTQMEFGALRANEITKI